MNPYKEAWSAQVGDIKRFQHQLHDLPNPFKLMWAIQTGDALSEKRKQFQQFVVKEAKRQKKMQQGNWQVVKKRHKQNMRNLKPHLAKAEAGLRNMKIQKPIDLPFSGLGAMVAVNALGIGMIVWGDPMTKVKGAALIGIPEPIVFMVGEFLA